MDLDDMEIIVYDFSIHPNTLNLYEVSICSYINIKIVWLDHPFQDGYMADFMDFSKIHNRDKRISERKFEENKIKKHLETFKYSFTIHYYRILYRIYKGI